MKQVNLSKSYGNAKSSVSHIILIYPRLKDSKVVHVQLANHDLLQLARVDSDEFRYALVERAKAHVPMNMQILHLAMLGWTNEMIGNSFNLDESTIRKRFDGEIPNLEKLLRSKLKLKNPSNLRDDAETPTPEVLVWALKLKNEKDLLKTQVIEFFRSVFRSK